MHAAHLAIWLANFLLHVLNRKHEGIFLHYVQAQCKSILPERRHNYNQKMQA